MLINENKSGYEVNIRGTPINKTSIWLNPSIYLDVNSIRKIDIGKECKDGFTILRHFGYINSYIGDKNHYNLNKNCLSLLFNPTNQVLKDWNKMQVYLENHKNYIETYDIDRNLIVSVLRIHPKWQYLVPLFIKGKFSKFGDKYASEFFIASDLSRSWYKKEFKIINKLDSYKKYLEELIGAEINPKWEYSEPPILDNEILDWKPNS